MINGGVIDLDDYALGLFDKGLSRESKAYDWALEKLCEDHFYWMSLQDDRWMAVESAMREPLPFMWGNLALGALLNPVVSVT